MQPILLIPPAFAIAALLAATGAAAGSVTIRTVAEGQGVPSQLWILRQGSDDPVPATTGADGSATIDELPCGKDTFIQATPLSGYKVERRTCYYREVVLRMTPE